MSSIPIQPRNKAPVKFLPKINTSRAANTNVSQGAEFAGSIVVFFLLGFGLDAWLNTTPVFMITGVVFSTVGQFIKVYYTYNSQMERLERERAHVAEGKR